MNRRHFLQSLAALGCGIALPGTALANAPDAIIEEAWQAANRYPLTFYVSSWGTISFGNDENWQKSRGELLGLMPAPTAQACSNSPMKTGALPRSSRTGSRNVPSRERLGMQTGRSGSGNCQTMRRKN